MPCMLILGATSDIARATALAFARAGWDLHLAGRNAAALEKIATDLKVRTERDITFSGFDALRTEDQQTFWEELAPSTDAVFCAIGLLGRQETAEHDMNAAQAILQTNFTGLVPVLSMAANTFEKRGKGLIIGIGSVAGDRGRASNYLYGSAKAGFSTFLAGLRNRLSSKGVHVMTVKPGFVTTAMTEGIPLPKILTATPEQVAADIVRGVKKRKNIVYTRWFWREIMLIIRHVPEFVFKKMKL